MDNLELFQLTWKYDKYLFSHAGVTKGWFDLITGKSKIGDSTYAELMDIKDYPIITLDNLNELLNLSLGHNLLNMVSRERGGRFIDGSCIWADVYEHVYTEPIDSNIYQVFGHTMTYPSILTEYIGPNFAMLDAQSCFMLDLESGKFIREN